MSSAAEICHCGNRSIFPFHFHRLQNDAITIEILHDPFLIQFHLFKIFPNSLVVTTTVNLANAWPICIDAASAGAFLEVNAPTSCIVSNQVGATEVPAHFACLQLLYTQGKGQSTTSSLANL